MPQLARALSALLVVAAVALAAPLPAEAAKSRPRAAPWRPVSAEVLMDAATGKVIRAHNADTVTYPASLTKMMTLLLTFEALDDGTLRLNQRLGVSRHATTMEPSRLGLAAGSTITVQDAILALVTKSANDVAVVLAEAVGGSEPRFARSMTARARALGMTRTVFRNASGLPHREQRTTARDMATLSRALINRHKAHYAYFSRRSFTFQGRTIYGHNRLLARYEGMDGLKTGFIAASGFNLAASAARDGRRLIAVVLGGETAARRDARVATLLDQGFRAYTPLKRPEPVVADAGDREDAHAQGDAGLAAATVAKGRDWGIQVGAFGSAAAAQRSAAAAAKALGTLGAGTRPAVVRAGKLYKARLSGLDSDSADSACAALKARRQDCFTVKLR